MVESFIFKIKAILQNRKILSKTTILRLIVLVIVILITISQLKESPKCEETNQNLRPVKFFQKGQVASSTWPSSTNPNNSSNLPWYFRNGKIRPKPNGRRDIWPEEIEGDKIINQLMYVPKKKILKLKKIYADKTHFQELELGRKIFKKSKCPVDACVFTRDKKSADAVLYLHVVDRVRDSSVSPNQVWIFDSGESPFLTGLRHFPSLPGYSNYINWTMSYRSDSDLVEPYGKWVYYNESIKAKPQERNYASGKSRKVAWFVSNCWDSNNRGQYARKLKKFIDVDIYGKCGDLDCPKEDRKKCMAWLKNDYKFYLAFENSNCKDYITEKFYRNALMNDVIPIVMGAHPDEYKKVAPHNSYIHVDHFCSPKELADYLHELDKNDTLYNSYFQWKGTGEFIQDNVYCRLCALLHANRPPKFYENFKEWWNKPGTCIKGSWLKQN